MKSLGLALLLAGILAGQIALCGRDGAELLLAPASVILSVVAASALLGELTWLSVIAGAFSAVALAWLSPHSPTLALVALCALWLSPRCLLARSTKQLAGVAALALGAAAIAGVVIARFAAATALYHFTACVFAGGSLALAATVWRANTVVASSLETAARLLDGAVRDGLLAAADAHRQGPSRDQENRPRESQWRSLLRLVDRRLAMRNSAAPGTDSARAELDARLLAELRQLGVALGDPVATAASEPARQPLAPGRDKQETAAQAEPEQSAEASADQTPRAPPTGEEPVRNAKVAPAVETGSEPALASRTATERTPVGATRQSQLGVGPGPATGID